MSYTKQALIIGGNGALGKAVVRRFKQDGWKVHSMDLNQNNKADQNIIVSRYFPMKD
jgi:NAD(P)-dependent dehydrogenase (short-subunit alcohol dehydrogenase family)